MNVKLISSKELVVELKNLVGKERAILSEILSYLREVELRRLYLPNYSSLFDFCVKELGYSSDQAYRRISAMRLVKEVPEAKEKLDSGALALSSAAELYRFIQSQKKTAQSTPTALTIPEKKELLSYACQNSKQDLQRKLADTAQKTNNEKYLSRETVKPITSNLTELKITLNEKTLKHLQTLHSLYSNKLKNGGLGKLVELLVEEEIERVEKKKTKSFQVTLADKVNARQDNEIKDKIISKIQGQMKVKALGEAVLIKNSNQSSLLKSTAVRQIAWNAEASQRAQMQPASRYIPQKIKWAVYTRDQGRCQHPTCANTRYLHFDHIQPLALGGSTTVQNLQLLCSAHNLYKGSRYELKT